MTTTTAVWHGNSQLRDLLRPTTELQTHPHNSRRGDLSRIADSLARFGQQKPIVVDADGTILAGNQVYTAAIERLGWSHVAAVTADVLEDDVDAYLFLVADNDASDEADYDEREAKVAAEGLMALAASAREALDSEKDNAKRDALAEQVRGLESAAEILTTRGGAKAIGGGIIDPDGIEIEHRCTDPDCAYEWRGKS